MATGIEMTNGSKKVEKKKNKSDKNVVQETLPIKKKHIIDRWKLPKQSIQKDGEING